MTLTTDDIAVAKDSATFLKQAWEEKLPGLTLNIKSVPFKQRLNDSTTGNFDMVISLWGGDYAEPSTFLDLFTSTSPKNNGKINNVTYDKAIKAAEVTDALDPENTMQITKLPKKHFIQNQILIRFTSVLHQFFVTLTLKTYVLVQLV